MDKRLRPETGDIDREHARANIFRFTRAEVIDLLIASGVKEEDFKALSYDRKFSVAQGFQHGDDKVFSPDDFTQIQIRDLQLLLLKTLDKQFGDPKPILLSENIEGEAFENNAQGPLSPNGVLNRQLRHMDLGNPPEITFHYARGAPHRSHQDPIAPPQKRGEKVLWQEPTAVFQQSGAQVNPDVESMPITPIHGTTTFFIKSQYPSQRVTCEDLERVQRSLDQAPWQESLATYGWHLIRPPRIRVFYANDVLYIGAEIPPSMMKMKNTHEYERAVTNYTRAIALLVFPGLEENIKLLKANTHLRSRFPIERYQRTTVLTMTDEVNITLGAEQRKVTINEEWHGDEVYGPHYQTGSGFVTGFLINEAYYEVYQHKTFHDLYTWAKNNNHLSKDLSEQDIHKKYEKSLADGTRNMIPEETILKAFQAELYMTLSGEIIRKNKEKVGN